MQADYSAAGAKCSHANGPIYFGMDGKNGSPNNCIDTVDVGGDSYGCLNKHPTSQCSSISSSTIDASQTPAYVMKPR